ncbi:hypothetical protein EHV15_31935 [Paenibacillus oralis]|uniref:Uncharacterized protein n=1 Tax=Paenibacillus oralis TaxID=2490856 RepID=A0A3P3UF03_9BACL|nr:hypothetical protein EHV15_31935 [Paenibacillus oralis]
MFFNRDPKEPVPYSSRTTNVAEPRSGERTRSGQGGDKERTKSGQVTDGRRGREDGRDKGKGERNLQNLQNLRFISSHLEIGA